MQQQYYSCCTLYKTNKRCLTQYGNTSKLCDYARAVTCAAGWRVGTEMQAVLQMLAFPRKHKSRINPLIPDTAIL